MSITAFGFLPKTNSVNNDGKFLTRIQADSIYLNVGEAISQNLDLNKNRIINLGDPQNPYDSINKKYCDAQIQTINLSIYTKKEYVDQKIPFILVQKFEFKGSKTRDVSYRTDVQEMINEKFRNITIDNIMIFPLCKNDNSAQIYLVVTVYALEIKDNKLKISIRVDSVKSLPWTNNFEVIIHVIVFP